MKVTEPKSEGLTQSNPADKLRAVGDRKDPLLVGFIPESKVRS